MCMAVHTVGNCLHKLFEYNMLRNISPLQGVRNALSLLPVSEVTSSEGGNRNA